MARDHRYERLSPQQSRFVDAYFRFNGNCSKAAREAGYSHPSSGYEVSRVPKVRAKIDEIWAAKAPSAEETIARISEMARASIGDFVHIDQAPPGWRERLQEAADELHLALTSAKDAKRIVAATTAIREILAEEKDGFALDLEAVRDNGHLVQEVYYTDAGPKIKLHSALDALKLLVQVQGLSSQTMKLTGADGGPLVLLREVVVEMPRIDDESGPSASEPAEGITEVTLED